VTGVSAEGWLGAGDAGSVGSQSLQTTVTASQWVGSSCSLPELIGMAVRKHLPYGICEKKWFERHRYLVLVYCER